VKTKCQLATPGSERDDGEELGDGDRSFTLFLFNKSETERKLEKLKKLRTVN